MSFIEMTGFAEAKEAVVHPDANVTLRCENVEPYESDKGRTNIRLRHKIVGGDPDVNYAPVNHVLALPKADDESGTSSYLMLMVKRYLHCAKVPFEATGFNPSDIQGAEFDCPIVKRQDENDATREWNELRLPKLPQDAS